MIHISKPHIHTESSVRRFKAGSANDFMPVHQFMDSSKSAMPDNRHRAATHNSWFIGTDGPLERSFGVIEVSLRDDGSKAISTGTETRQSSMCPSCLCDLWVEKKPCLSIPSDTGRRSISIRDIGEQHIQEDFTSFPGGYIPSLSDYLQEMEAKPWMSATPLSFSPSAERIAMKYINKIHDARHALYERRD